MTKRLNPLLDPRGFQERPIIKLAPRVSVEELKKNRNLQFDGNIVDTFLKLPQS
jgi:hypothetical protein